MGLRQKDLVSIQDLTREEIDLVLRTADTFQEIATREIKKVPTLRGRTVVTLFFEASTRTRVSFEIAAKRLSADTINISATASSAQKGETLLDTCLNLEAMTPDIVIVRHPMSGAPALLAQRLKSSVINAGDGTHEHPTQALLDLYTMRQKKGRIEGLTVAIIGDIAHSRVARSNIFALTTMGADVWVAGPPTLIPLEIERLGVKVTYHLREAIAEADVIMMLRIQWERLTGPLVPSAREYARYFGLTLEALEGAKKDVIIMHPGPMNRGVEIDSAVADGPYSVILSQVANGVAVRMALLYLLGGGAADAAAH